MTDPQSGADFTICPSSRRMSVPSDLDSSHERMLDKLKGLNGADFTKQYDKD